MLLGAHVSTAGGLPNAVTNAQALDADTFQFFCKNQRQWHAPPLTDEQAAAFRTAVTASGLGPLLVHDSYLINLGHRDDAQREKSYAAFLDEYRRCEALGVPGLNFHLGSHLEKAQRDDPDVRTAALDRVAHSLRRVLAAEPAGRCRLVLENAAGQGTNLGYRYQELAHVLARVEDPARIGVCIDTQHAWAAGYDWVGDYEGVWREFDAVIGNDRLVALHLNDSHTACGSRVDRHADIGEGMLGEAVFRRLMNDPRLCGLPGFLETPGGPERWRTDIKRLRKMVEGA